MAQPAPADPAKEPMGDPSIAARQLHFAIGHSARNSWAVWVIVLFMGLTMRRHPSAPIAFVWLLAVGLAYSARALALRSGMDLLAVARRPEFWRRRYVVSILACGALVAIGPPLFFPAMDGSGRAYLTMVISCWLAGAMAGLGPIPGVFARYAEIMIGGLVAGWLLIDEPLNSIDIVIMLVIYGLIVNGFAKRTASIVNEGLRIRQTNELLVADLRVAKNAAEESNLAKSRFLAVASHDLRQPLHALTLLNGLLTRPQNNERTAEISAQMARSLSTLDRMFSSILDLSKLDASTVQPHERWMSLSGSVGRLLAEFGAAANANQIQLVQATPAIDLYTDPDLFERILRNLLENALKFTERGEIAVAASVSHAGCVVSVADSGVGIPANLHEDIFKEYFQANTHSASGGLGLGLAIVKRLCQLVGISIRVRDNLPRGARFELLFPPERVRVEEPGAEQSSTDEHEDVNLSGFNVLCVDDDSDSLGALGALLTEWGCAVLVSSSPEGALAVAHAAPRVDAVLSDYALNASMNGEQLLHALREVLGPIPAALLTGDEAAAQAQKAGLIEFPLLSKPVSPVALKKLLEVFKEIE